MKPIRFINQPIEVSFEESVILEKKPGCPDEFTWRDQAYRIVKLISEWHDYSRRGRMKSNMRTTHAQRAQIRGSWGVGQDYYRVITDSGEIFDIYYDRAPKSVDHRKGGWFLYQELSETD